MKQKLELVKSTCINCGAHSKLIGGTLCPRCHLAKWRINNPDKVKAYRIKYVKNHQKQIYEYMKMWRKTDTGRQSRMKWYSKNKERMLAYLRAYRLKNREKINARQNERRRSKRKINKK